MKMTRQLRCTWLKVCSINKEKNMTSLLSKWTENLSCIIPFGKLLRFTTDRQLISDFVFGFRSLDYKGEVWQKAHYKMYKEQNGVLTFQSSTWKKPAEPQSIYCSTTYPHHVMDVCTVRLSFVIEGQITQTHVKSFQLLVTKRAHGFRTEPFSNTTAELKAHSWTENYIREYTIWLPSFSYEPVHIITIYSLCCYIQSHERATFQLFCFYYRQEAHGPWCSAEIGAVSCAEFKSDTSYMVFFLWLIQVE